MGNIGRLGSEGGVRRKLVASLGRRVLVRGRKSGRVVVACLAPSSNRPHYGAQRPGRGSLG